MTTPSPTQSSSLSEEVTSAIRVAAAGAAGFAATQLVRLGFHVDQTLLVSGFVAVFSTGYYTLSRYLAKYWPAAERLLLLKKP